LEEKHKRNTRPLNMNILEEHTKPARRQNKPRKLIDRKQYFVDWPKYQAIWHLPDRWIAEGLAYTLSGVASARKREAPEQFQTEPTDRAVCLESALPYVEGKRYTAEMVLELLVQIEALERKLAATQVSAASPKKPGPNYALIGILVIVSGVVAAILSASLGVFGGVK